MQLSKALSYALRHGALKLGLPMGADGFVPLGALLQLPQFRSFSAEDVQRVVHTNGKQRFALQPGDPSTGPLIRANQGHSLQVGDKGTSRGARWDPCLGGELTAAHPLAHARYLSWS